ncbi:hypothetical protein Lalb_Chr16g0389041 [Lupinus albus]|uniref:Uncharacterized protein n=1 Tax=Lupinus albus TaxID=3870 RepID=A0A6A4P735_LUPAL|nr:hypothetical protein Lalb_Chr16g0389041 [Lupinus albus]
MCIICFLTASIPYLFFSMLSIPSYLWIMRQKVKKEHKPLSRFVCYFPLFLSPFCCFSWVFFFGVPLKLLNSSYLMNISISTIPR